MSTTGQYGRRNSARDGPLLCADKEPIKGKGRSTRRERPHAKDRSTLLKGAAPATLARRERLSWRTYKPTEGLQRDAEKFELPTPSLQSEGERTCKSASMK